MTLFISLTDISSVTLKPLADMWCEEESKGNKDIQMVNNQAFLNLKHSLVGIKIIITH